MSKRVLILAALAACVWATPAMAQDPRVEVSFLLGWTFSDGVDGDAFLAGDGNVYDRVDPEDSFKWGFDVGVFATPNMQVGFIYGNQPTTLTIGGTNTREIGDLTVSTYHGYFAYNYGESDAKVRPYIMGGLGATTFGEVPFTRLNGQQGTIGSETQFSTTWGGGVKFFPAPKIGARIGIQWTPTYIKSDAAGWWCDPYWGCYLASSAQYSNQWDIQGGVTFRF